MLSYHCCYRDSGYNNSMRNRDRKLAAKECVCFVLFEKKMPPKINDALTALLESATEWLHLDMLQRQMRKKILHGNIEKGAGGS